MLGWGVPSFLLAGRGGEEEERCGAFHSVTPSLLAGRGGEGWRGVAVVFLGGLCIWK
jgi:hypothetical protein